MKRCSSNPFRVMLSGIIDFAIFVAALFVLVILFRSSKRFFEIHRVLYPIGSLLATGLTIGYSLIWLPAWDSTGGSLGKRIMHLKCVSKNPLQPAGFGNYFLKNLLYGLPIVFGFALSFELINLKEDDNALVTQVLQIMLPGVFVAQALSLIFAKRSLFEWASRSVVISKKKTIRQELFSFEEKDMVHLQTSNP